MAEFWDEQLVRSKYHLSVARRLYDNFQNYEGKRFLSSSLTEMARGSACLVNAVLIYSHHKDKTRIPVSAKARLEIFEKAGNKMLGEKWTANILLIFKIKKAQRESPIELLKKDKVLLLDHGEYKALTVKRMEEVLLLLEEAVGKFSEVSK